MIADWEQRAAATRQQAEALPKQKFENGVRVIAGEIFDEVARDPTKDFLVMFYEP
jgi:hypothetical protein